ncbi:hypothetical protein D3C80_1415360 [compost metagenome]
MPVSDKILSKLPVPPDAMFSVLSTVGNNRLLLLFRASEPAFTSVELTASKVTLKWSVAFCRKVISTLLAAVALPVTSNCAELPPAALITFTASAKPDNTKPCEPIVDVAA